MGDDTPTGTEVVENLDTYTDTVEYLYTDIAGEKVRVSKALDFLEKIIGTSSFDPLRYSVEYSTIAEAFVSLGLVEETNPGSWFSVDDEELAVIQEELEERWYDES
jgi:hypothetical protein